MNIEVKNSVKLIDYNESIYALENRVNDVLAGKKSELLWLLEHNSVYTAGTSAKKEDLIDKSIKAIKTKRGGKYTLHSPGQKVVYFVLNLNKREKDIRKLISKIETCIIKILKEYNIKSNSDSRNIGIWVNDEKIAAIGVRVKKWIAYHGFSINVNNDLSLYNKIIPCGIKDKNVTSFEKIGISNYENINDVIKKNFLNTFL